MPPKNQYKIDKTFVRRAFDNAARSYDSVAVLQHEVERRLLERLGLIKLRPRRVLDAGCGTGSATLALRKAYRGASVAAMDLSGNMLRQTRARCGWRRRADLVCGDIEALPFTEASIDLIYSNLTLQWCNDLKHTFAELLRVLRPGGVLMFTTFGPDTLKELRHAWSELDNSPHVHMFYDMHDVGDLLLQTGFQDPVIDVERMTLTYPDLQGLMRDLKLMGAQNKTWGRSRTLTGKGKLARLIGAYETFRLPEGQLPASYEVIYGQAWRATAPRPNAPAPSTEIRFPIRKLRTRDPGSRD